MADDRDSRNSSELSDQTQAAQVKEDAETAATRKELRHTAISEQAVQHLGSEPDDSSFSSNNKTPPPSETPDNVQNDDQAGSPKKKRAYDELEADQKDDADGSPDKATSPSPSPSKTPDDAQSDDQAGSPRKKRAYGKLGADQKDDISHALLDKAVSPPRSKTPDDAQSDALRDQVGSPKKKRARDELEADQKDDADAPLDEAASPRPGSRTTRSEPEKKRHRDEGSVSAKDESDGEGKENSDSAKNAKEDTKPISTKPLTSAKPDDSTTAKGPPESNGKAITSEDAFKKSGFSALASSPSPFTAAAAPGKSVFGGNISSISPFGAPFGAPLAGGQKSVFGTGAPSSVFGAPSATGPDAPTMSTMPTLGNSSFQSPFGAASNGSPGGLRSFGSSPLVAFGADGGKLSSFATPGQSSSSLGKETKSQRDFGAPESDGEEDSDEDGDVKADEKDDATSNKDKEDSQPPSEEKKKPKLQKVRVDEGEATEATLVSVRAKIYALDRAANSWKERGTGYLKINVPIACVAMDYKGNPIPGSFDGSTLAMDKTDDGDAAKGPRMIMRQDHTHRVILNAAVTPATKFNQTDSLKAAHLIFQAFEETGLTTLQLKMSTANVKGFLREFDSLIQELAS